MSERDEIKQLNELLRIARLKQQHFSKQVLIWGSANLPFSIKFQLNEAYKEINDAKNKLKSLGVPIDDLITDTQIVYPYEFKNMELLDSLFDMRVKDGLIEFIGREEELLTILNKFQDNNTIAITGMVGVGKTRIAREFVKRYGNDFEGGVFWIDFSDPKIIDKQIIAEGISLNIPNWSDFDDSTKINHIHHAWQQKKRRLLIFDNCEDEGLLSKYRPFQGGCCILITSRYSYWSKSSNIFNLSLSPLKRDESKELLQQYGSRLDIYYADQISEVLGDLPFALVSVGKYLEAYLDEDNGDIDIFLSNLQQQILEHSSLKNIYNVQSIFQEIYDKLDVDNNIDKIALIIISCLVYTAPDQPIPMNLLLSFVNDDFMNEERFMDCVKSLKRLVNLGFLMRHRGNVFYVHSLIRSFLLKFENKYRDLTYTTLSNQCEKVLDDINSDYSKYILNHIRYAQKQTENKFDIIDANLSYSLARIEYVLKNYSYARILFERSLLIKEKFLPFDHPEIIDNISYLADSLCIQREYNLSKQLYEKILSIKDRASKKDYDKIIIIQKKLADIFREEGDLLKAKRLYNEILKTRKNVLEQDNINIIVAIEDLANVLYDLEDYQEAAFLYENILNIHLNTYGWNSLVVSDTLKNIGDSLYYQGQYNDAYMKYKKSFDIRRNLLGMENLKTIESLNDVGDALYKLKKYRDAGMIYKKILDIGGIIHGGFYIDKELIIDNLAHSLYYQGLYAEAEYYYKEIYIIRRGAGRINRESILRSLIDLVDINYKQGKYLDAEAYCKDLLEFRNESFGFNDTNTLKYMETLADILCKQKKFSEAKYVYQQLFEIKEKEVGLYHLDTLNNLKNILEVFNKQQDFLAIKELCLKYLPLLEVELGVENYHVKYMSNLLDETYADEDNYVINRIKDWIVKRWKSR